ncbi:MAG TPA: sulfotransferase [Solirubrobacteraceae bacterium]|nr:sulfotransferase [Solirubrobacteraceae bacterium]
MRVIGAGLPRSATTTQMFALETLGFGGCYHMRDVLADMEKELPLWERVAEGDPDWERIFEGRNSAVDWPASRYYAELADYYPEAKVVLSVRDAADWVSSMRNTVWAVYFGDSVLHHVCEARAKIDPLWERYIALMRHMTWEPGTGALVGAGDTQTEEGLAAAMEDWHARVRAAIAPERLLVWDPREGYEPLCEFLEVEVPAEPLPRLNDTVSFKEGIIGGGLAVINEWWDARERPSSGLHGAPLESSPGA